MPRIRPFGRGIIAACLLGTCSLLPADESGTWRPTQGSRIAPAGGQVVSGAPASPPPPVMLPIDQPELVPAVVSYEPCPTCHDGHGPGLLDRLCECFRRPVRKCHRRWVHWTQRHHKHLLHTQCSPYWHETWGYYPTCWRPFPPVDCPCRMTVYESYPVPTEIVSPALPPPLVPAPTPSDSAADAPTPH